MKLTVFAILLLALMGGLILVQIDSNAKTPFETLSGAEMLATQGAGLCEEWGYTEDDWGDPCGDTDCRNHWWYSVKREGKQYALCGIDSTTRHCDYDWKHKQTCAVKIVYVGPSCIGPSKSINLTKASPFSFPGSGCTSN